MRQYAFRIVNVFAKSTFEGNPLCVFEDAEGLDDQTMLKLAQQFNLSETVFVFDDQIGNDKIGTDEVTVQSADKMLRIFTPSYELPFAGHPVIGASSVISELIGKTSLQLLTRSGLVPVNLQQNDNSWQLKAPCKTIDYQALNSQQTMDLHALLDITQFAGEPAFVNTGSEQLIIPLETKDQVDSVSINSSYLDKWPAGFHGRKTAYLFHIEQHSDNSYHVYSRFVFLSHTGAIGEDPGTGSACANLGGWLANNGYKLPLHAVVTQGVKMGRECELLLDLISTKDQIDIFVGGKAIELGKGVITL